VKKTLTIIAVFGSLVVAHAQIYEANLDGLQEGPPNSSPGYGTGDFSLSGTTLSVTSGSYQDLLGNSTAITLNDPHGTNVVIFMLTLDSPGTTSGTFSGSVTLTSSEITDLQNGNLYVNLRSNVYPGGEIGGKLEPVPEPATLALMGVGSLALLVMRRRKV
jgi:hypothetical protein